MRLSIGGNGICLVSDVLKQGFPDKGVCTSAAVNQLYKLRCITLLVKALFKLYMVCRDSLYDTGMYVSSHTLVAQRP